MTTPTPATTMATVAERGDAMFALWLADQDGRSPSWRAYLTGYADVVAGHAADASQREWRPLSRYRAGYKDGRRAARCHKKDHADDR